MQDTTSANASRSLIPRPAYLDRIRAFQNTDIIKVLTGLRRSGKSALLQLLRDELIANGTDPRHIITLNLESAHCLHLRKAEALREHLMSHIVVDGGQTYIFLDEIQMVDGWEDVVNSIRVAFGCDIYVTGSNAKMLSGELATMIAGRYVKIEVFPFSFREFLAAQRRQRPDTTEAEAFRRYLILGGLPYLTQLGFDEFNSQQYLRDLFEVIELRDIVDRTHIRDTDLLRRLLLYVLAAPGTQISARSLVRYLKSEGRKVSLTTLLQYLRAGADAYLFYPLPREDLRGKKILSVAEKYYIADQGMREAVLGGNMQEIQLVLENIVCLELLRRGYKLSTGDNGGREIDFIARRGSEQLYVQVSYLLASKETEEREFGAFRGLDDNYPKFVVTLDEFDLSRNGYRHWNMRVPYESAARHDA